MLAFVIAVIVSAAGSIAAYIFKDTVLAAFKAPSPAQAAVNTESRMAADVVNAPDQAQAVRTLEAGDA